MHLKVELGGFEGIFVVEPLFICNTRPSVADSLLCEGYTVPFGLAENLLPKLSNFIQFDELWGLRFVCTHLSWSHLVIILN